MIHMTLPWLPPSANHAYANIRGTNKRVLTTEGKSFKTRTTVYLAQTYPKELTFFKPDKLYILKFVFFFEQLENAGWPKKALSRYKKIDVSNRLKLLEDALKDAAGIDDSQHMGLILVKKQDLKERVEIWAWDDQQSLFSL